LYQISRPISAQSRTKASFPCTRPRQQPRRHGQRSAG